MRLRPAALAALLLLACGKAPPAGSSTSATSGTGSTSGTTGGASTSSGAGTASSSSSATSSSGGTSASSTSSSAGSTSSSSATSTGGAGSTGSTGSTSAGGTTGSANGLHVLGNQLVDANGQSVRLLGVNRSGAEYACRQGWGFFDGPVDDASLDAIATWHVNAIRLPLNEDCWLDLNGMNPAYAGANYIAEIQAYVARMHAHGFYVILDLHWTAPGSYAADAQNAMADADHAPDFWRSVAATFASDPDVIFDVFNEPYLDMADLGGADAWACWRDGCAVNELHQASGTTQVTWQSAGMQALVDAVRSSGATQPIMLGGLAYSNDLSGWLSHQPSDPQNALVASTHVYNFNTCSNATCWNNTLQPVAAQVPLVFGELGEDDCAHGFIDTLMPWADALGVSYLAWTWDAWGGCGPVLITDYDGTPTTYGQGYRDHVLQQRP